MELNVWGSDKTLRLVLGIAREAAMNPSGRHLILVPDDAAGERVRKALSDMLPSAMVERVRIKVWD